MPISSAVRLRGMCLVAAALAGCAGASNRAASPDAAPAPATAPSSQSTAPRTNRPVFAAIYRRGPAYVAERTIYQQPTIAEHVRHHEALGPRLIGAGALRAVEGDQTVGLILFEAENAAEAEAWFRRDPAIVAGVFTGEVRQWGLRTIRAYPAP